MFRPRIVAIFMDVFFEDILHRTSKNLQVFIDKYFLYFMLVSLYTQLMGTQFSANNFINILNFYIDINPFI